MGGGGGGERVQLRPSSRQKLAARLKCSLGKLEQEHSITLVLDSVFFQNVLCILNKHFTKILIKLQGKLAPSRNLVQQLKWFSTSNEGVYNLSSLYIRSKAERTSNNQRGWTHDHLFCRPQKGAKLLIFLFVCKFIWYTSKSCQTSFKFWISARINQFLLVGIWSLHDRSKALAKLIKLAFIGWIIRFILLTLFFIGKNHFLKLKWQ